MDHIYLILDIVLLDMKQLLVTFSLDHAKKVRNCWSCQPKSLGEICVEVEEGWTSSSFSWTGSYFRNKKKQSGDMICAVHSVQHARRSTLQFCSRFFSFQPEITPVGIDASRSMITSQGPSRLSSNYGNYIRGSNLVLTAKPTTLGCI